jgi:single-strand DNA-binding protein
VAAFRIASTPSRFNKDTSKWEDGDSLFLRCSVWRQAAENVAESLQKGMRVVVQGRLKQRQYETREGEKRTVVELDVDEVGPSLKYATAKVSRTTRQGGGGGGYSGGGGGGGQSDDPWATPAPQGGQSGGPSQGGQSQGGQGGGQSAPANDPWAAPGVSNDEPPF